MINFGNRLPAGIIPLDRQQAGAISPQKKEIHQTPPAPSAPPGVKLHPTTTATTQNRENVSFLRAAINSIFRLFWKKTGGDPAKMNPNPAPPAQKVTIIPILPKASELGDYIKDDLLAPTKETKPVGDKVVPVLFYESKFNDLYQRDPKDINANNRFLAENCKAALQNMHKNRYNNVLPNDALRVVLKTQNDQTGKPIEGSDYINASHVKLGSNQQATSHVDGAYIAAQAPTDTTIEDHYRAIWEQNCGKSVMLTNFIEGGNLKSSQYFPQEGFSYSSDKLTVTNKETQNIPGGTKHTLDIINIATGEKKTHDIYHFTTWPDHGVADPKSLLAFRDEVNKTPTTGPLLVHCSAGLGRTGAYIAIDAECAKLETAVKDKSRTERRTLLDEHDVNIDTTVLKMRESRDGMVQNANQYLLISQVVNQRVQALIPELKYTTLPPETEDLQFSEQAAQSGHLNSASRLQYGALPPETNLQYAELPHEENIQSDPNLQSLLPHQKLGYIYTAEKTIKSQGPFIPSQAHIWAGVVKKLTGNLSPNEQIAMGQNKLTIDFKPTNEGGCIATLTDLLQGTSRTCEISAEKLNAIAAPFIPKNS